MKSIFALIVLTGAIGCASISPNTASRNPDGNVKKQAPGYYRFMVGDIEVTTLLDGTFPLKPADLLQGIKPAEIKKMLAAAYEHDAVVTSDNAYLINSGDHLVLIDTGMGAKMPSVGHMLENLKASGYNPEQVTDIFITHMHGDHVGGLTKDGKAVFPKATLWINKHDVDYWTSDDEAAKADAMRKATFADAKMQIAPYRASGHFKTFEGEKDALPVVTAHPAYGHTPGHTVYSIESKGQKLWLIGDLIHVAAVQFAKPSVTLKFDSDNKKAAKERAVYFNEVSKSADLVGGAHLAFPGVGHIRKAGAGYVFTPMSYGWGT